MIQDRPFLMLLLFFSLVSLLNAQDVQPVGDWVFHPNYTLKRNAANYPGNKIEAPKNRFQRFRTQGTPMLFYEQLPTERLSNFLAPEKFPTEAFTFELWLLNHVNLPVGGLITIRSKSDQMTPACLLGYYEKEAILHAATNKATEQLTTSVKIGWKKYWSHLVGTYDGTQLKLFLNGKLVGEKQLQGAIAIPADAQIEIAGYFSEEPYMEIANLVKSARLYDVALDKKTIQTNFKKFQAQVEAGQLFGNTFHFNAGPYLNLATKNSINLLWETDQMATATIEYGTSLPLQNKKTLSEPAYIQEITLDGLKTGTPYYYQITAKTINGQSLSSGLLTFSTAVDSTDAFSFCIIGDTESRPQVNHRLGEMIWEERPNFIMHLGDVTDGGQRAHKFEWNYEYFTGIVPVASRIPVFPVPGNGESDLYWYNRYHRLPGKEAYYTFKYGNAEFFMLNTNANTELKKGGEQYEWLQQQLAQSNAKWKFVAHHHCPVSSDENDFGNTWNGETSTLGDPKLSDLKALYESAGVDVVFYGHVHAYERSYPLKNGQIDQEAGVVYIKSGGAGGHLEDFTPTASWFSKKVQRGHHFCKVDLYKDTFSFKMYDIEGRMKDFFELQK